MSKKLILLLSLITLILSISGESLSKRTLPKIISYEIEAEFYPDHKTDYAGLIEILEGKRPPWNKEDSIKNYPYMKGKVVMDMEVCLIHQALKAPRTI